MTEEPSASPDDSRIEDDVRVLRRIPPGRHSPTPDGALRPNSDTFSDDEDGECCAEIMVDEDQPDRMLIGHPGFGVVAVTAGEIREVGFGIVRRPIEDNPHHALITGRKTHGKRKSLTKRARWVRYPSK